MRITAHSADDFAQAMHALLPPGEVWEWPEGGFGDTLLRGMAQELARVDAQAQDVLDTALALHKPKVLTWRLVDYRAAADASQIGVVEARRAFAAGSGAGQRLWRAPPAMFAVPLVKVSAAKPFAVGSGAGQRLWGHRARYLLVVRYYKSVTDLQALWDALMLFKQAHVYLFFMDITGTGGEVVYAQN